jgi:hypothetical protein
MSLHTLAGHLQKAGRGQDSVLVHMTPGEVKGLQSLAMSQGGSLTINPETGLPEAGILSSLLPMVAGFFLGPAGLGLTAMQSAVAVGALGTAATGSLGKGFMMGLGAYGGAGLGQGLTSAGAANLPTGAVGETAANLGTGAGSQGAAFNISADKLAPSNFGAETIANTTSNTVNTTGGLSGIQPFANSNVMAANPYGVANPYNLTPTVSAPVNLGTVSPPSISSNIVNAGDYAVTPNMASSLDVTKAGLNTADAGIKYGTDIAQTMRNTPTPVNDINAIMSQGTPPSAMDKLGAGFDRATSSWEGAKEVWNATPKGTGYGLAATGMSVLQAQQEEAAEDARRAAEADAAERRGYVRPYDFSTAQNPNAYAPSESTSEREYFYEPRFTARPIEKVAKDGGLMSLAVGGPVEEMSAENSISGNTMYPQAQLQTSMYSNPMVQRPMPTDVISSGIDAPTNRYTGEARFAFGGSATAKATAPTTDTKYSYNPETMQYTQSTTTTPTASNSMQDAFRSFYGPVLGGGIGVIGGGNFTGFSKGFGGLGGATINPAFAALYGNQQAAPQPAVTTETSGGFKTQPYVPPNQAAAADTSMVPNIQIPQQQSVNQQLGLEAFYPMMEQNLAMRGAKLKEQGYAAGGVTGSGALDLHIPIEFGGSTGYTSMSGESVSQGQAQTAQTSKPFFQDYLNQYAPSSTQADPLSNALTAFQDQQQGISGSGVQTMASGGMAGIGYNLGGYSDGGRLLKGPGDGVSDSIPAVIGNRQPARLADGEFVIPARIVSELGNGSTEAGARKLYAMMDRVQKARRKTVGKNQIAKNTKVEKLLPA